MEVYFGSEPPENPDEECMWIETPPVEENAKETTEETQMFTDIANKVHRGKEVETGVEEDQFVLQHTQGVCTFVGQREDNDTYVVGKMWEKSEIVGRDEPRLKTWENEYIKCELYRMDIEDPTDSNKTVEQIADDIKNDRYDEKLDTGYVNGWMTTPLEDVLEDVFKWY